MEAEEVAAGKGRLIQKRSAKKNAFKPAMRAKFFDTLADTANVRMSAEAAGVAMCTVYRWRQRNLEFRTRWEEALAHGYAALEAGLLERARESVGEIRPGRREGALVGAMDAKLAMALLNLRERSTQVAPGDGHKGRGDIDRVIERLEKALKRFAPETAKPDAGGAGA